MNCNSVFSFFKEDSVFARASAEQPFKFTPEQFDSTRAGFGITMDGVQNMERCLRVDRAELRSDIWPKLDSSLRISPALRNLIHCETAFADHLLEGNAPLGVVAETFSRFRDGPAIVRSQFVVIFIEHDFQQSDNRRELSWVKPV